MQSIKQQKTGSRGRKVAPFVMAGGLMLGLTGLPAGGAERALSENEFFGDMPVVLTASRLAQPVDEAPAAMTVIDREMIEASGARDLSDVLRLVPGMVVGQYNGHRHVVSYHGLTDQFARRMQVLIDGRSVYLPSYGGVSWSDLPLVLDDVERIEVTRGPNAASHGANSFLGVINIITREAAAARGTDASVTVGTNRSLDGMVRHHGGSGNLNYRLTVASQQDIGFENVNDSRKIRMMTLRADYQRSDDRFEYQAGFNGGPRGRGRSTDLTNPPHDQEITSRFQQLRWRRQLAGGDEFSLQVYHNHHESDEQFLTGNVPVFGYVPLNYDVTSDRYDIEAQHNIQLGKDWRVVWGASARLDQVQWPSFLSASEAEKQRLYRLFGHGEWRVTDKIIINAGVMAETNEITGGDASPRASLHYLFAPDHTLRLGYSRAVRTPVLLEEYGNGRFCLNPPGCTFYEQSFLSTGGLMPEQITSREIGYLGRFGQHWSFDLRAYRDQARRLIEMVDVATPATAQNVYAGTIDFQNIGGATIKGAEWQLQYQSPALRLIAHYAYTDIDSSYTEYLRTAPRHAANLMGIAPAGRYRLSAVYHYYTELEMLDGDLVGPMRHLDIRVARPFKAPGFEGEVAIFGQNLVGDRYEYNNKNTFERRYWVTVRVKLP